MGGYFNRRTDMQRTGLVDVHVGTRIRQRRALLGMSQTKLGQAIGITFQQVQKYERGANRIGSGRLYELARALDVPVSFFFEEMPSKVVGGRQGRRNGPRKGTLRKSPFEGDKDPLAKRETMELIRAYYKIGEARVRKRVFEMVKTVAVITQAQ